MCVVFADDPPADEEWVAAQPMEDAKFADGDTLMKTLRSGEDAVMKKIYVIAVIDSSNSEKPIVDWTKMLQKDMETFKYDQVMKDKEKDDDPDEPLYTKEQVQEYWKDTKKWPKGDIEYATVDLKKGDDGKEPFKNLREQLIEPYYTGPVDRAIPALFVLKGTGAFLITGPKPMDALKDVIKDLHDDTAFKAKK